MAYKGHYSDGKSALRHDVEVHFWGESLRFRTRDRGVDEHWSGDKLRLLEEAYSGKPARLTHDDHPDAVVTVVAPAFLERLVNVHPRFGRSVVRGSTGQRIARWSGIAVVVLATLIVGGPRLAVALAQYVPHDKAAQLGEAVVSQYLSANNVCDGAEGTQVLRRLADELLAQSSYTGTLTLRVVDDPRVNAFAAPGGQVILFRGLIDTAQSGDQVAGVLAHELAHVVEKHALEGLAQQLALRFVLAMIVGDVYGLSGTAAAFGGDALVANYSRDIESQADSLAVALLNRSGYAAAGLSTFFQLLEDDELNDLPDLLSWLSSHPLHEARIAAVRAADTGGTASLSAVDWAAVQQICGARADESSSGQ